MSSSDGSGRATGNDAFSSVCPSPDLAGARDRNCARRDDGAGAAAASRSARCNGRQTMSAGFRAVQWNRDKVIYDAVLAAGVVVFLVAFATIAWQLHPPKKPADAIDIWIRATGSCAFLMLTII